MALDENINTLEKGKFEDGGSGKTNVRVLDMSPFQAPDGSKGGTIDYPNATTEVVKFRAVNSGGTVLKTLTLVYSDSTKENLISWDET